MNDGEAEQRSGRPRSVRSALANEGEAYAIPVAFHHEDDRVSFRLGLHSRSTKARFLDATDRASSRVYDTGPSDRASSIVIAGPIERLEDGHERFDDATTNAPVRSASGVRRADRGDRADRLRADDRDDPRTDDRLSYPDRGTSDRG